MNYSELQHAVSHLNFLLHEATLEQISDGNCRIQLGFKTYPDEEESRRRTFIIFDFKASHLDLYPTRYPKKAPAVPQAFTMLMRKYLINQRVASIRLASDDRIIFLDFGRDETVDFSLIAEYTGCSPKIFLIDAENQQILGLVGDEEERTIHSEYVRPETHPIKQGTDKFEGLNGSEYEIALDEFYTNRDNQEAFDELHSTQLKRLKRSITRTSKLIESLKADLDKVEAAKIERIEADILNAYAYQVKKGVSSVELPDFETGNPVHIQLDPTLSVRGNIDRMYNHAKRMLKAQSQIENRLLKSMERLELLNQLNQKVIKVDTFELASQYQSEVEKICAPDEKNRPSQNQRPTAQTKAAVHQPFRTFTSADGTKILVGKSASDNDDLTFHYTRGNDTWLHVCQVPGSHVVVKHPNPSQETLLDAALLALHYSKLAQNRTAEIHVTQVKYVRKIKGAPAGKVEIRGEKAIHIKHDEKRLARILATQE